MQKSVNSVILTWMISPVSPLLAILPGHSSRSLEVFFLHWRTSLLEQNSLPWRVINPKNIAGGPFFCCQSDSHTVSGAFAAAGAAGIVVVIVIVIFIDIIMVVVCTFDIPSTNDSIPILTAFQKSAPLPEVKPLVGSDWGGNGPGNGLGWSAS